MILGEMAGSVVRELANIGLAHATTALAELTGRRFDMAVPQVESVEMERLPYLVGDPYELAAITYMAIDGDVGGRVALLMPWASAQELWMMLVAESPDSPEDLSELQVSMLLEVGNMVNSGLLNAISDMTQLRLHATPPQVAIDSIASLVGSIVCEASYVDSVALSIQTLISDNSHSVRAYFVYIPTVGGLRAVFASLGIEEAA